MKICIDCRDPKPLSEFSPDRRRVDGRISTCRDCRREKLRISYSENPDKRRLASKILRAKPGVKERENSNTRKRRADAGEAYRKENRERAAAERLENPEASRIRARRYRTNNLQVCLARKREWLANNGDRAAAHNAKRRATISKSVPRWVDDRKIAEMYAMARAMTAIAGIPHEVDHIVPLVSPLVSGLHWHGNLQIITKVENLKKGNRYWPGMPGEHSE